MQTPSRDGLPEPAAPRKPPAGRCAGRTALRTIRFRFRGQSGPPPRRPLRLQRFRKSSARRRRLPPPTAGQRKGLRPDPADRPRFRTRTAAAGPYHGTTRPSVRCLPNGRPPQRRLIPRRRRRPRRPRRALSPREWELRTPNGQGIISAGRGRAGRAARLIQQEVEYGRPDNRRR